MNEIQKEKKIERAAILPGFCESKPVGLIPYLLIMSTCLMAYLIFPSHVYGINGEAEKLAEEYSEEEKKKYAKELLELGDALVQSKIYDQALAAYEQVFLMDPQNRRASAKIDLLRKQMEKEGIDETSIVKEVYEDEARERTKKYWEETRTYLEQEKFGQARFTIEKILLLDPFNKEAKELYEKLKAKPVKVRAPYETRETV